MDLKRELQKVEKKLLEKKEQIELKVVKIFNEYAMHDWSYEADDSLVCDMCRLRDEYIQTIATLNAIRTIIDYKEVE